MNTETENGNQAKISSAISLYQLEQGLLGLMEAREAAETDEERAVCDAELQRYAKAEVSKVDGILAVRQHCKRAGEATKAEAERLGKLSRAWFRRQERLDDAALAAMLDGGKRRLDGALGSLLVYENPPSSDITDAGLVPLEYKMATVTMPAAQWYQLLDLLSRRPVEIEALSPGLAIRADVEITVARADVLRDLKRWQECEECRGRGVVGLSRDVCPACKGSKQQPFRVAGARLMKKVRLEVK